MARNGGAVTVQLGSGVEAKIIVVMKSGSEQNKE